MKIIKIALLSIPGLILAIIVMLYIAGSPNEKESKNIAGSMSKSTICKTTGYIIKNKKGKNFDVYSAPCTVKKLQSGKVSITSAYTTPINNKTFNYNAIGHVIGNELTLERIQVFGIDKEHVSFNEF